MKSIFIIAFSLVISLTNKVQLSAINIITIRNDTVKQLLISTTKSKVHIGLGMGIDYGGYGGIKVAYVPFNNAAFFAAGGYALIGLGFNAGVTIRILPNIPTCPYISVMYGSNAVIKVIGASQYDKIYFGPTFSVGIEFRSSKLKNFFNAEILFPMRSNQFKDDWEAISYNPKIKKISRESAAIGISFGYHFVI